MNMNTIVTRSIAVLTSLMFVFTAKSNTAEEVLARRVESLHSIIDMRYTSAVEHYVDQYTERHPSTSERLLGQASVYFPMIENIIREKNMPEELKYLAVIESGLRPDVKSKVGATGMWQFMRSTGKMYGLTINNTIDERKDVIKSTYAALDYLSDLHDIFGDWTVALAAYNCGPGNVRKAMRKAGGATDYWSIQKYLPRETRRYVPKFIAMQYMMSYYHMHEISPELPAQKLRYLAATKVYERITFKDLSKRIGLDANLIKTLNPSYVRSYIPATEDGRYTLTLPEDDLYVFLSKEHTITFDDIIFSRKTQSMAVESTQMQSPRDLIYVKALTTSLADLPTIEKSSVRIAPRRSSTRRKKNTSSGQSYMARYRAWSSSQGK